MRPTPLCALYAPLHGRDELEIVDISRQPALAEGEQIIAAPTLIKKLPRPLRRFMGDMSHTGKILLGLDLCETGTKPEMKCRSNLPPTNPSAPKTPSCARG